MHHSTTEDCAKAEATQSSDCPVILETVKSEGGTAAAGGVIVAASGVVPTDQSYSLTEMARLFCDPVDVMLDGDVTSDAPKRATRKSKASALKKLASGAKREQNKGESVTRTSKLP